MSGQADGIELRRSARWAEFIDRTRREFEDRGIPFVVLESTWQDGAPTAKAARSAVAAQGPWSPHIHHPQHIHHHHQTEGDTP